MKTFLQTLFFFLVVTQICFAQWENETNFPGRTYVKLLERPHNPTHIKGKAAVSLHPSFYDRKADWQWIIDSTWGPGESLSEKLSTFDYYQEFARAHNATFLWNPIDWDSLVGSLRSQINDSTSRGGFAAILKKLSLGMMDGHAYAYDDVLLNTPLNPGVPILTDGGGFINHFGAGLTPLADSSLLVYKVVPNHPLGLVPGDIILGYEGVAWSQIVRELIAGGVPNTIWAASASSAYKRSLLWAAGESWHLFDTIDVKKYATGQIEHLPLDSMVNLIAPNYIINNEQMPIPGVPMPLGFFENHGAVTYGIIDGTNIGYIYVYHHVYQGVSTEFDAAVQALMQTEGLIIDIRVDWGGSEGLNTGISRLLNYQTSTLDFRERCNPNDLFSICPTDQNWFSGEIDADIGTYYDRPVAVLLGPNCGSMGDISSWQFSYIPNAKMFGRSPAAMFSAVPDPQPSRPGYALQCPNLTLVDHYTPNVPLWGQEYPSLEEVWLTPDGVANGEDDVVNRALEWMNNLVYPHNVLTNNTYYIPGFDTVHISTIIENPNSHQISARAYLNTVEGTLIDSVDFIKQTLENDGEEWRANLNLLSLEEFYKIGVTVFDVTVSDQYKVSNATRFTTAGPVSLDSIKYIEDSSNRYALKPFVTNNGNALTITDAKIRLVCDDPWVLSVGSGTMNLPPIPPGEEVTGSSWAFIEYNDTTFPGYFNINAEIIRDGWVLWTDSIQIMITGIKENNSQILSFNLEQNYPNPFNPSTKIKYFVPQSSQVQIKIFDVLGNEIETLVNEEKPAGNYELTWNAGGVSAKGGYAPGVYFYQLRAGSFVETKKMILLK